MCLTYLISLEFPILLQNFKENGGPESIEFLKCLGRISKKD